LLTKENVSPGALMERWRGDLKRFRELRKRYLIYSE
jgi:hypothetical protein